MEFNGPFVLSLLIALIALALALASKGWVAKLIFFIFAIGATNLTLSYTTLNSTGVILLFDAILFLVVGVSAIRLKGTGVKILGILFLVVGLVALVPAINLLAGATSGPVLDVIVNSARWGWDAFWGALGRLVNAT